MKQILFSIGGFSLHSYGLLVAIAILLGLGVAYSLAEGEKEYRQHLMDVLVYAIIGSLVGARIWQVFFYDWAYYSKHLVEIPMIWMGGMSILGSLVGAAVVGYIYTRSKKINFWRLADVAAPGLIFGQAVGRIACLLNGDAYGDPTHLGYGLVYPPGTPAYEAFGSQPLWPAEVWEGQWDIIVFALILILSRWRKWPRGIVFLSYIFLYAVGRFGLEYLRGDSPHFLFNWTAGQWTSFWLIIFALVVGTVLFLADQRKKKPVK